MEAFSEPGTYGPDAYHPGRLEDIAQRMNAKIELAKLIDGDGRHLSESPDRQSVIEVIPGELDKKMRLLEEYREDCHKFLRYLKAQPVLSYRDFNQGVFTGGDVANEHEEQLEL